MCSFALFFSRTVIYSCSLCAVCAMFTQVVEQSTVKQDDDSLLKCLIELAESVPKYLKSHLEEVVRFALKVCNSFL